MNYFRSLLPGLGTTVVFLFILILFPSVNSDLNEWMLSSWYRTRGEQKADSSIVIVYFGSDDITMLGGIPIKRSYYALVVQALHDLGANVIGIDIAFTESEQEHPEYDKALSTTVQQAGNVVLSTYFRGLTASRSSEEEAPSALIYEIKHRKSFFYGKDLQMPFQELLFSSAGCGHTNLMKQLRVPLMVNVKDGAVPAFFLEVLRVSQRMKKSDITVYDDAFSLNVNDHITAIPIGHNGVVRPNFRGGIGSFETISALSFLRSYDSLKQGIGSSPQLNRLKGKIVLVGIIAEGRSAMFETPFASNLPPIVLHATLLDNALGRNFLLEVPQLLFYVIIFVVGVAITLLVRMRNEMQAVIFAAMVLIAVWSIGYIAFAAFSLFIPVSGALIGGGVVLVVQLIVRHSIVQSEVDKLLNERNAIMSRLHDKEQALSILEQKVNARHPDTEQAKLHAQIEQYQKEIQQLKNRTEDLQPYDSAISGEARVETFHGIVYSTRSPMAKVVETIKKIADHDASVLIIGESGTGKEVVAKALHECSLRNDKPFIAVNCGALTETLLESELFGHEKGAFTGAIKEKPGRFELANEGTIFLDEIAETSEVFQIKLLRILQEGTFERVGGTETKRVNVRVLAATNRDVKQAITEKKLREDLYYRLNVFTLELPPLRERKDDIVLLTNYFISQESATMTMSKTAMNVLQYYSWRGNVRELQSAIKRAVVLAKADGRTIIRLQDLPEEIVESSSYSIDLEQQILEILREKKFSRSAISETAEQLGGMNRGTVAEYFRGYCFRVFTEKEWNIEAATNTIAGNGDATMKERVQKKLLEYLQNAVELVDAQRASSDNLTVSKSKYKNLPQKYHEYLSAVITAYCEGKWSIVSNSNT